MTGKTKSESNVMSENKMLQKPFLGEMKVKQRVWSLCLEGAVWSRLEAVRTIAGGVMDNFGLKSLMTYVH